MAVAGDGRKRQRSAIEIQDDESRVELFLCQGYSVRAIMRETGLSEGMVRTHKSAIEGSWKRVKEEARGRLLGRIVSNQIHLQRANWEGWERSKMQEVVSTHELSTDYGNPVRTNVEDEGEYGSRRPKETEKTKTVTKQLVGNPAFLANIARSDALLARLMGLEEEEGTNGTSREFMDMLRSQIGIGPEHFEPLQRKRLQREEQEEFAMRSAEVEE